MVRRPSLPVVLALLGLLSLAQAQHGLTVVGDLWWAILSWDNSATHDFEAQASVTPPIGDPVQDADQRALAAAQVLGRLPIPDGPPAPQRIARSGRITRSPPASRAA